MSEEQSNKDYGEFDCDFMNCIMVPEDHLHKLKMHVDKRPYALEMGDPRFDALKKRVADLEADVQRWREAEKRSKPGGD